VGKPTELRPVIPSRVSVHIVLTSYCSYFILSSLHIVLTLYCPGFILFLLHIVLASYCSRFICSCRQSDDDFARANLTFWQSSCNSQQAERMISRPSLCAMDEMRCICPSEFVVWKLWVKRKAPRNRTLAIGDYATERTSVDKHEHSGLSTA
jgi:hypothetical protein